MDKTHTISSVTLDEEFEHLVKPLSEIDNRRLRIAVRSGDYARIRVWENIVLCDSQIYKICRDYNFDCAFDEIQLSNRNAAISYVCQEELQRDDLTHEYKKYLIGKRYNADCKRRTTIKTTKLSVARLLSEDYFISAGAVQKYGQFANAIDSLFLIAPAVSQFILQGQLKLSHENTIEISHFPIGDLKTVERIVADSWGKRITIAEIQHAIRWKSYVDSTKRRSKSKKTVEVEIKKMPAYDPDADISSISLTIPSWVRAIKRAVSSTTFEKTTYEGRSKFKDQLIALDEAIIEAIDVLEV